jgi:hypothetical protein
VTGATAISFTASNDGTNVNYYSDPNGQYNPTRRSVRRWLTCGRTRAQRRLLPLATSSPAAAKRLFPAAPSISASHRTDRARRANSLLRAVSAEIRSTESGPVELPARSGADTYAGAMHGQDPRLGLGFRSPRPALVFPRGSGAVS